MYVVVVVCVVGQWVTLLSGLVKNVAHTQLSSVGFRS